MRPSAAPSAAAAAPNYGAASPETDLASPNFDPKQFLAVHHAVTSFSSLQNELNELRRTTSDKTEQLKALVSAHFDQYLSCHEAVRALADDIRAHQRDSDGLVDDMKNLKQVTDSTLSVMLQRAKEQRRIRNTIAVLNRFRPIFEITTRMKDSLRTKDYERLAEDYCRLKSHQTKTHVAALQPVVAAAHEIAKRASNELLEHFDDISLSVKDQKRAIAVVEALGLVEKPTLLCLRKQFDYLEARLTNLRSGELESAKVVTDCAAVIYRFRSGLWGFVCELFMPLTPLVSTPRKALAASTTPSPATMTSAEAESVQQRAWTILSSAVELIEKHSSSPTAVMLRQLNESFREINSLKNCRNATTLNDNVNQLKSSFCDKFRIKVVLQFLQQTCKKHRDQLMMDYFEPLTRLQSLETESILSAGTGPVDSMSAPEGANSVDNKIKHLIQDACDAFKDIQNASMISSESKVRLTRAPVLTSCAVDIARRWEDIWTHVGQVLLELAEAADNTESGSIDSKGFRVVLAKEFSHQLRMMLSTFLEALLEKFIATIIPPTVMASVAGSARHRKGAAVCIVFVIASNCIELREKHFSKLEKWLNVLVESSSVISLKELRQVTIDTESKCIEKYVAMHSEPLAKILAAGAAEELLQNRFHSQSLPSSLSNASSRTDSLRMDSRTTSSSNLDLAAPPTPTAIASAIATSTALPQDPRQYVFNVLLQLITLRSEIETCLGHTPASQEYVQTVSSHLTAQLGRHLQDAVGKLEKTTEPSESRRIHLLVEVRFYLFALRDLLSEDTKIQLIALEKALEKTRPSEKVLAAQTQLLSQLKHQTKLYLLALQHARMV